MNAGFELTNLLAANSLRINSKPDCRGFVLIYSEINAETFSTAWQVDTEQQRPSEPPWDLLLAAIQTPPFNLQVVQQHVQIRDLHYQTETEVRGANSSNYSTITMAREYTCNPQDLQFTQLSVKDSFSKGYSGVKLQDTVADLKAGRLDPSSLGPLTVHQGDDGRLWCENNRRLLAARQAGLREVDVKFKSNDFISRRLPEETREKLSDPDFLPKVRVSRP